MANKYQKDSKKQLIFKSTKRLWLEMPESQCFCSCWARWCDFWVYRCKNCHWKVEVSVSTVSVKSHWAASETRAWKWCRGNERQFAWCESQLQRRVSLQKVLRRKMTGTVTERRILALNIISCGLYF